MKAARETRDGEGVLAIRLQYDVISTRSPGNGVILAGVEGTVIV